MSGIPDQWSDRIEWLRDQALQTYRWNDELQYFEVKDRWRFDGYEACAETPTAPRLVDAFQYRGIWEQNFPNLARRRILRIWDDLSNEMKHRISDFFTDNHLHDFEFFDHGGWAIVFKARDTQTGRYRMARIGCDSTENRWRFDHPTILPFLADNHKQLDEFSDIKLEIMPEVVPLNKVPARPLSRDDKGLQHSFHMAAYYLGHGTNLTYPKNIMDEDSEYHNIGLLPDGKLVTFDPIFTRGDIAETRKDMMEFTQEHRDVANKLYGLDPAARFF